MWLGAHMSSSRGFSRMVRAAAAIGGNTCQFFCRNPRGSRAKALDPRDLDQCRRLMAELGFGPVVAHAPYIMNPCARDEGIRQLAEEMMAGDLHLMEHLPGNFYVFHPGSHVGQGAEAGCAMIARALNRVLRPEQSTVVLLETMVGKGSEIGGRFEELRAILDQVELQDKVGVCLDTCHMSDAGYDVRGHLDNVLEELDRVIGLDLVRAAHINDSVNPMGARKDRHAPIGEGYLGLEGILRFITHPSLRGIPFVLETPWDDEGHSREIALLRRAAGEVG